MAQTIACSHCKAENPSDFSFCFHCGAAPVRIQRRGAVMPADAYAKAMANESAKAKTAKKTRKR